MLKSSILEIVNSIRKTTAEDEPRITEYDTLAGDGDCGQTLLNGITGEQILRKRDFLLLIAMQALLRWLNPWTERRWI